MVRNMAPTCLHQLRPELGAQCAALVAVVLDRREADGELAVARWKPAVLSMARWPTGWRSAS